MASSSDWIAALAPPSGPRPDRPDRANGWIAQLGGSGAFIEGAACLRRAAGDRAPEPDLATAPHGTDRAEPDPLAEAYALGEDAGRAAASAEFAAQAEQLRAVRLAFRAFDQAAIDSLAGELAATVIALCGQAFANFTPEPEALLARCAEAAERLGSGPAGCTLLLHPADLALIDPAALEGWRVVPDAAVGRGGLRLEGSDGAVSDGPADWRRAIAAAIRG